MRRPVVAGLLVAVLTASPVSAQQPSPPVTPGVPQSAVVVLDRDALFGTSEFGLRVARDIEAASAALVAENREIELALEAEERALTEQRPTMDAGDFRDLAGDFDDRVVGIRRAQDAKARAIQQQSERAQALFFEQANPVLIALARETGALVILDRRIVIASADQVDITALARSRIDAVLGEGEGLVPPQPIPRPEATTPDQPEPEE
ncbi:MAG: OmpH family outer membrane protein [Jannaschia sp.]